MRPLAPARARSWAGSADLPPTGTMELKRGTSSDSKASGEASLLLGFDTLLLFVAGHQVGSNQTMQDVTDLQAVVYFCWAHFHWLLSAGKAPNQPVVESNLTLQKGRQMLLSMDATHHDPRV